MILHSVVALQVCNAYGEPSLFFIFRHIYAALLNWILFVLNLFTRENTILAVKSVILSFYKEQWKMKV